MKIAMIVVMMNSDLNNLFPDILLFFLLPYRISLILINSVVKIIVVLLDD